MSRFILSIFFISWLGCTTVPLDSGLNKGGSEGLIGEIEELESNPNARPRDETDLSVSNPMLSPQDQFLNVPEERTDSNLPNPTPTPNPSALNCSQIIDCLDECDFYSLSCEQNCVDSGYPVSKTRFYQYISCYQTIGCTTYPECNLGRCIPSLFQCETDTGLNEPQLNCSETFACFIACSGDTDCANQCIDLTHPQEQSNAQDLITCSRQHGCSQLSCIYTNCPQSFNQCIPQYGASCVQTLACIEACTHSLCQRECIYALDPLAVPAYNALSFCMMEEGCAHPNGCFACEDEAALCQIQ